MTKKERKNRWQPAIDYRKLRLHNLTGNEFKHLLLLLYWPVYGLLFMFVERFYAVDHYTAMYCRLDDLIPFCEWFVIPYLFWFVYMIGMILYTLLYDIDAFRYMMRFIIITYSITIAIYLIWPTCQNLRPAAFERDNLLTRFMAQFYQFDTNTNVCPSIHVLGTMAVLLTSYHCRSTSTPGWKIAFTAVAVLICASTVFLKQHSILDVAAAFALCPVPSIAAALARGKRRQCAGNS